MIHWSTIDCMNYSCITSSADHRQTLFCLFVATNSCSTYFTTTKQLLLASPIIAPSMPSVLTITKMASHQSSVIYSRLLDCLSADIIQMMYGSECNIQI